MLASLNQTKALPARIKSIRERERPVASSKEKKTYAAKLSRQFKQNYRILSATSSTIHRRRIEFLEEILEASICIVFTWRSGQEARVHARVTVEEFLVAAFRELRLRLTQGARALWWKRRKKKPRKKEEKEKKKKRLLDRE